MKRSRSKSIEEELGLEHLLENENPRPPVPPTNIVQGNLPSQKDQDLIEKIISSTNYSKIQNMYINISSDIQLSSIPPDYIPTFITMLFKSANSYMQNDKSNINFYSAINIFNKIITLDPNNYYAQYNAGVVCIKLALQYSQGFGKNAPEHFEKAIQFFQKAQELNPDDYDSIQNSIYCSHMLERNVNKITFDISAVSHSFRGPKFPSELEKLPNAPSSSKDSSSKKPRCDGGYPRE